MKKLFITSMYLAVFSTSSVAYGLGSDVRQIETSVDALNALKLTRCSVYTDLQQNMRSSLYSLSPRQIKGFGIDDTKSYAQQQNTTLSRLSVEG